jgi:hypothetical protein
MKPNELKTVAETFEQGEGDIPTCLEYYSAVEGATIENFRHPDHIWTILDRLHSMALDDPFIDEKQTEFLQHFLEKWMKEIEPYCVRLEVE